MTSSQPFCIAAGAPAAAPGLSLLRASLRLTLALVLSAACLACGEDTVALDPNKADATTAADSQSLAGAPSITSAEQPAGGSVHLQGQWQADRQRVSVEVRVRGNVQLVGVAGHLRWDPKVLQLDSVDINPKLLLGDANIWEQRSVNKQAEPGRLLLGTARFRKELSFWSGVESLLVKDERWLTATFAVVGQGQTDVVFAPESTVARDDTGAQLPLVWTSVQVSATSVPGAQ